MPRSAYYQPRLAWFTAIGSAWVFVLVMLGAFTTSIGAGMVFPDWPLSNGSLNPDGWLTHAAMFAEHSHRLSAGLMSVITFAIAIAVHRSDARPWLRNVAWFAVGLVLAQALVGGLRVLLDHLHIETVNTSVGRLFAMLHACLAQIYVCTLLAVSLALSRGWIESQTGFLEGGASSPPRERTLNENAGTSPFRCQQPARSATTKRRPPEKPSPDSNWTGSETVAKAPHSQHQVSPAWRSLAWTCCALLLVQLAVAAVMRHSFAGMAIPTFPWSTPEGAVLPAAWDFRVGIHFAHRAMAALLSLALVWLALRVGYDRGASPGLKLTASSLVILLILQITLGAASVLTYRNPYYTTAHVIVGAVTLATCFGLTWWASRDRIEDRGSSSVPRSGSAKALVNA